MDGSYLQLVENDMPNFDEVFRNTPKYMKTFL